MGTETLNIDECDFSGWATRNNILCSDGRTILKDAFKHQDGTVVPLLWNHDHKDPENVLGKALLKNKDGGVYAYAFFNDTPMGRHVKGLVQHGDITSLSIFANQLKEMNRNVNHGQIRELSVVYAGANPGAYIDTIMAHSDSGEDGYSAVIYSGEEIVLTHSEKEEPEMGNDQVVDQEEQIQEQEPEMEHADKSEEDETVQEVVDSMTEKQKTVLYALVGQALEEGKTSNKDEESKGGEEMKHNAFDVETEQQNNVLSHADMANILTMAKSSTVGSFKAAMEIYAEENSLAHGIDEIETLFPDPKEITPIPPEMLTNDLGWVGKVIAKAHKTPYGRIKTRQADARIKELRAFGYKKGDEKKVTGKIKLIGRKTEPQTIYVKDELDRDDILDITDFSVVEYNYKVLRNTLNEEIATAMFFGDGRDDGEADKIHEDHIRPIWTDNEIYTMHVDVDIEKMKKELQGSDTSKHFGENYIFEESIVQTALYAREKFKGTGTPDFYCTPHTVNVMLLARDLNGRRLFSSKAELAAALNVNEIITVEQMAGRVREAAGGKKKELLGIFVNMADYELGSVKGGEITKFQQFDIDFNKEKFLLETRLCGALAKLYSAIALELPVAATEDEEEDTEEIAG